MYNYLFILAFSIFSFNSFANNKVKVSFDCVINNDNPISCQTLKQVYFENPLIVSSSESEADVIANIRMLESNLYIFKINMIGQNEFPTLPEFEISFIKEKSNDEILIAVANNLTKFTAVHFQVKNIQTSNSTVNIAFGNQEQRPTDTNTKSGNFYVAPGITGNLSQGSGVTNMVGGAFAEGVFSKPTWKIMGGFGSTYLYSSTETTAFAPGIKIKEFRTSGGLGGARNISKRWSVMLFAAHKSVNSQFEFEDPSQNTLPDLGLNNTATFFEAKTGIEWILIPFQESDSGNIAVRYVIGGEFHKYVNPESFEYVQDNFLQHAISLQLSKHFKKVTVSSKINAFTKVTSFSYSGLDLDLKSTFRLTDRINLSLNGGVNYSKNRLLTPVNGPTFISLTSGNNDVFSFTGNVGLNYTIGNSRLPSVDRRWKQ